MSQELLQVLDWSKVDAIAICYVFRKTGDTDFKYPYQGELLSERHFNYGYRLQFLPIPPSRTYVPLSSPGQRSVEMTPARTLIKVALQRLLAKKSRDD